MASIIECSSYGCTTYSAEVVDMYYEGNNLQVETELATDGTGALGPFAVEYYMDGVLVGSVPESTYAKSVEKTQVGWATADRLEIRLYVPWANKEERWFVPIPEMIEDANVSIISTDDANGGRGANEAKVTYELSNPNSSTIQTTIDRIVSGSSIGRQTKTLEAGVSETVEDVFEFDYGIGTGQHQVDICIEHVSTEVK